MVHHTVTHHLKPCEPTIAIRWYHFTHPIPLAASQHCHLQNHSPPETCVFLHLGLRTAARHPTTPRIESDIDAY